MDLIPGSDRDVIKGAICKTKKMNYSYQQRGRSNSFHVRQADVLCGRATDGRC